MDMTKWQKPTWKRGPVLVADGGRPRSPEPFVAGWIWQETKVRVEHARVKSADSAFVLGKGLYHVVAPSRSLEHEVSQQERPRFRVHI